MTVVGGGPAVARRFLLWCVPLTALGLLAACAPPPGEQAAARVNGITILQDEVDLVRTFGGEQAQDMPARRLVEALIVKELLAQQFLRTARGSAEVAESALSVARRELLAQRYVAALVGDIAPPDAEQVRAFYRAHPGQFAKRRAFVLRTLEIRAPPAREPELRDRVRAAASLDQLVKWLRTAGLRFTWSESEHTSDQLAPDSLAQLAAMRNSEVTVQTTPDGVRVIQLIGSRPATLDEPAARPLIERRLWARMRAAALDAEVKRLSGLAAISIGDGESSGGTGQLTAVPDGVPTVFSRVAPQGPVTGRAPGGGDAQ